jgi:two-component sensor histidine kinase
MERQMSISESELSIGHCARVGAWLYLDEVMHRVLNDYTVMLSTVRIASSRVSDSESGQALEEVAFRLKSSAMAFRALSPPSDRSQRYLDEELEALCAQLSASILAQKAVQLTLDADPVCIDAQRCWQICLVVSELVTNAARHAFRLRGRGSIVVKLSSCAGMAQCAVIDDGSAPEAIVPGRGSAILDAIAVELGGVIVRNHTGKGSAVVLQVPIEPLDRRDQPVQTISAI